MVFPPPTAASVAGRALCFLFLTATLVSGCAGRTAEAVSPLTYEEARAVFDNALQSTAERYTRSAMTQIQQEQVGRLIKYALIILSVAPIVSIYPFMQRYFIQGVMIGSLKE